MSPSAVFTHELSCDATAQVALQECVFVNCNKQIWNFPLPSEAIFLIVQRGKFAIRDPNTNSISRGFTHHSDAGHTLQSDEI